ncbi:4-carboxy-4-hydroxy-2-oxoadipate aldolase/oxaloacetate decarboxylase [Cetobacterium sp. 8H]|uniref:4-carboxy-4-hydroxy-2-oxoadipate aldolase/oxaloacetate decarboxylase n=1 Tax=Cetobacterium sp. 8H TaxID=2759681 RepID=UPI00163C2836|nr:4-carboxy-4-hydroxy-2-oxoadipate aldolase/oxaloacetate decarboxylase [Cetobacterium sp. 8H]MBC2850346.1 4-carboxy-4-hydroxy-2-oxoadipate aldolase/oxaloacetate decarboxylase [Cetobacterium sp. 8H]
MEYKIKKNIERKSNEVYESFKELGVATVYEAQGQKGLLNDKIKPIQMGVCISGPAITVKCGSGDNLMIHAAVEFCKKGDILVVTTEGESNKHGMIGDLLVQTLIEKEVKGLIIDGGIRDSKRIRELGFPVWTTAIVCSGTTKIKPGTVNNSVVCAGTQITGGDLILADDDGVVVVKLEEIGKALEAGKKRESKEIETLKKIKNGELGIDFYGFRERLKNLNVQYVE